MSATWDQSRFDATLKELLMTYESSAWPRVINKHGFFTGLAAYRACQRLEPAQVDRELSQQVLAAREDGRMGAVSIGDIIAAKRASANFTSSRFFQREAIRELRRSGGGRGKEPDYRQAWLRNLAATKRRMIGGRKASVGFLRAGFISIVYGLAGPAGLSRPAHSRDLRGQVKGTVVHVAREGQLSVTIQNSAHSRTEKLGGFERIGSRAIQDGLDHEEGKMRERLEGEMEPGIRKFNQSQH